MRSFLLKFLFLQFTSRLHLHTASQEVHFEVDHCDHCLSAGLFHSSQDQPESCHYMINKSRVCCHDGKTKAISHCPEFFEPLNYKLAKKICLVCMRCKIFVCKESYKMLMKAISGAKSFAKNQKRLILTPQNLDGKIESESKSRVPRAKSLSSSNQQFGWSRTR